MEKHIDNTELLFIAACKSEGNRDEKLDAIYKTYYLKNDNNYHYINSILTSIVDKYCKVTVLEILGKLKPQNSGTVICSSPFSVLTRNYLVNKIAFTETSKFPGLTHETRDGAIDFINKLITKVK